MTRLSVVIVSYRVKYFLELALQSVRRASKNIPTQVFVVDNNSSDGSVEFIREKFPDVKLIENTENLGFAKANNQAIRLATGEYILLLNPDTVVQENTFEKCLQFMDSHPEAGALGVKMLDGKGNFLPESKRALPVPSVAFWKMTGMSSLFPKSKLFARYHLGFLNENENHGVEVLAGAFMLIRKNVLDKTGLLDEDYFMYGEDIDLSYRITKAGYKNFYFSETSIIHYKGESTKKGSLNYVRMFYKAMVIFSRKHFSVSRAGIFSLFISVAVYFKAFFDLLKNFLGVLFLPLLDSALIIAGMYFIKDFYAKNVKGAPEYYPAEFMYYVVPAFTFLWVITTYFSGGYDKPFRIGKVIRGVVVGTVVLSAIYGLIDESLRYSRALILLGAIWTTIEMILMRMIYNLFRHSRFFIGENEEKRLAICGDQPEINRTLSLLNQSGADINYIGFLSADENSGSPNHLGNISRLKEVIRIYSINEIIFCLKDLSTEQIVNWMAEIGSSPDYKIVPENSNSIIGSNSKSTAGDFYAPDFNLKIERSSNRRNKRVLDLFLCLFLFLTLPVQLFIVKKPVGLISNLFSVLFGMKSWVGYSRENKSSLPKIKMGILAPPDGLRTGSANESDKTRLNLLYAKEYSVYKDVSIVRLSYRELGRLTK